MGVLVLHESDQSPGEVRRDQRGSGAQLTPEFVREVGRLAYFFAWPMVNIFNRYSAFLPVIRPRLLGGIAPIAPINHLCMLNDYIDARQRYITCPSQDLVYGFGNSLPMLHGQAPHAP